MKSPPRRTDKEPPSPGFSPRPEVGLRPELFDRSGRRTVVASLGSAGRRQGSPRTS